MVIVMYGAAIQEAIASGDLAKMKLLKKEAEKHLKEWGNMPHAFEILKVEIAKTEAAAKKSRKTPGVKK